MLHLQQHFTLTAFKGSFMTRREGGSCEAADGADCLLSCIVVVFVFFFLPKKIHIILKGLGN